MELKPLRISSSVDDNHDHGCLPVFLRIRPREDQEQSIKVLNGTTVETTHAFRTNKKATYTRIFSGSSSQKDVFRGMIAHPLRRFLDGANVMIFAYGVTSSGKTHTIMGSEADPGILPRVLEITFRSLKSRIEESASIYRPCKFDQAEQVSIEEIDRLTNFKSTLITQVKGSLDAFDRYFSSDTTPENFVVSEDGERCPFPAGTSCSFWISVYEIHNDVVTDLLSVEPRSERKALAIGQDARGRSFIKELMQVPVGSASEAYAFVQFARQNLAMASTKLNDNSSRSHMVFTLKTVHWGGSMTEPFVNQFVICDLAGSERQAKTGTSGLTLKQAGAINSSLTVLSRCLEALRNKNKGIAAPYRESKLTHVLNPFFTLGGYVSLIVCINPSIHLQDETMDTIRFSAIASEIVQDSVAPLERLRQLRRLTLSGIESKPMFVCDTDVENWRDAVNETVVYNGVPYVEVRASYFNDMARDILHAQKTLTAFETEMEAVKRRLKECEASKENVKLMYQDKMKEQRDKFAQQRIAIEEMYRNTQNTLVEEFEEDIRIYKEKYSKYKEGYAKLSGYLKEKLWPEVELFRERFGYLPEFPPRDAAQDGEVKPENTIKYWQDKLQNKEVEYRSLMMEFTSKVDQIAVCGKGLVDKKEVSAATEVVCRHCNRERGLEERMGSPTAKHQSRKIFELEAELSDQREKALRLQGSIVSLQDEVLMLRESEAELKDREVRNAFKLRDARRTRAAENNIARLADDLIRLRKALEEEKKASAAKEILFAAKEAEMEELRDRVRAIEVLGNHMRKLSKENKAQRGRQRTLAKENRLADTKVEPFRELGLAIEVLTKELGNPRRRINRSESGRPTRRPRSVCSSGVDLEIPAIENSKKRFRLGNDKNLIAERALKKPLRCSSPASTSRRTRSCRRA